MKRLTAILIAAGLAWFTLAETRLGDRVMQDVVVLEPVDKTNIIEQTEGVARAAASAWAATGTVWAAERLGGAQSWTAVEGGTNWLYTVTRSSNVVLTAVSGEGYNGPAVGTVLSYSYQTSPTEWVLESSGWKLQFINNGEASEALLVDVPALAKYWFGAGAMPITAAALMGYDGVGSLVLTWKTTTNRVRIATEPMVSEAIDDHNANPASHADIRAQVAAIPTNVVGGWLVWDSGSNVFWRVSATNLRFYVWP